MHKYFFFDTASRERRELRAFTRLKALYGFDQSNRADGD
jgi:hypothetical protein